MEGKMTESGINLDRLKTAQQFKHNWKIRVLTIQTQLDKKIMGICSSIKRRGFFSEMIQRRS